MTNILNFAPKEFKRNPNVLSTYRYRFASGTDVHIVDYSEERARKRLTKYGQEFTFLGSSTYRVEGE